MNAAVRVLVDWFEWGWCCLVGCIPPYPVREYGWTITTPCTGDHATAYRADNANAQRLPNADDGLRDRHANPRPDTDSGDAVDRGGRVDDGTADAGPPCMPGADRVPMADADTDARADRDTVAEVRDPDTRQDLRSPEHVGSANADPGTVAERHVAVSPERRAFQ